MGRHIAVAASIGLLLLATAVAAQQAATQVTGKWEVTVTGQPMRPLELTVEGTVVSGTLAVGPDTVKVTGEFKEGRLRFSTNEESFYVGFRDGVLAGTYIYSGPKEEPYKTGVTLKRPKATN